MCGLIGWISRDDSDVAPDLVLDQYERQCERGQRGFGLIEVAKSNIRVRRATEPVKALLDVARSNAPTLLFHHRFPTSTENDMEQTHPILVSHDELTHDYYVMHNGIIRNPNECRREHEGLGYAYRTKTTESFQHYAGYAGSTYSRFNDSEAFAIELARFIEKKSEGLKAYGAAAFIALAMDKKTKKPVTIFFGTNGGNPLQIMEGTGLLIGSELPEDSSFPAMPNMLYAVDCKKLFNPKNKSGVMTYIATEPLTYIPEPEIVRVPLLPPQTRRIGFTADTSKTKDAEFVEDTLPVREEAAQKRLDRFLTNLVEEVLVPAFGPFFDNATYGEPDEDDVDELLMSLRNELLDQLPLLQEIREHFDEEDEASYADYTGTLVPHSREGDNESIDHGFKHISEYIPF